MQLSRSVVSQGRGQFVGMISLELESRSLAADSLFGCGGEKDETDEGGARESEGVRACVRA